MWKRHFQGITSFDTHATANLPLLPSSRKRFFQKKTFLSKTFVRNSEILPFQPHSTANLLPFDDEKKFKFRIVRTGNYSSRTIGT